VFETNKQTTQRGHFQCRTSSSPSPIIAANSFSVVAGSVVTVTSLRSTYIASIFASLREGKLGLDAMLKG
jgi:hypothetical protein